MIGLTVEDESLSRLLWAVEARDERDALRGYFTDLALRRYDAAMAMSMPDLIDRVVEDVMRSAAISDVQFAFAKEGKDVGTTFDFLDRFEEEFYQMMRDEIERRER